VGVLYTLNREEDGKLSGPEQKNYIAQFGSTEIVFQRLRAYLDGLQKFEKLMFMSDGAPHYVTLREQYFPEATAVIDFYHVCEYLWKAGETVFESGSKELGAFISELKGLLLEGKVIEVVASLREKEAELPRRGPGSKGRRKRMKDAIKYIETRQELMPYAQLRLEGLEIGTGVIESAVRQVVAIRFEGPGMRWGAQRPQHLLDLLCLRLSDGWSFFANVLEQWVKEPQARTRMTPLGVNEKSSQDPSSQLKQKEDFPIAA
jgi:hypothetical protein